MRSVEKIRILLVTRESLRKDSNEGNVILSLFGEEPVELAHICCKSEQPDPDVCHGRYFQITDKMAVRKLLRGAPMGAVVQLGSIAQAEKPEAGLDSSKKFYDFFRTHNWNLFYILQDMLWALAGMKSPEMNAFIDAFKPDLVFAPLTPYWYANRLQNEVIRQAGVPAVTYLYDDIYSLKQISLSPFYWLHRFAVRSSVRKNLPLYQYAYTMTEQQKQEYERLLNISMRVLRKCAPEHSLQKIPHDGVKLIYAGGIYYGRDKTLIRVAQAVSGLRAEGYDVQLHIYTASPLKKRVEVQLNDGTASFVHSAVPSNLLAQKYAQSDIALHVESLRKKDALTTRLSFSTKIVDCLASGCAVLAICPEINAGWQYLQSEGAAMCVSRPAKIGDAIRKLATDNLLRECLCSAAMQCLEKNHNMAMTRKHFFDELVLLVR